ncbi:DNA-binding protein [Lactobacillus sp. PSON]|uniref:DNA-binding protein n=1 Tax=Lactobacillus sp. PSON TaxID=3455454 RepID=UPI004042CDA6
MQLMLDQESTAKIQELVINAVNSAVKNAKDERPYLNRQQMAKYMGVSPDTITHWANMGMPVATLSDGRKLYGKKTVTEWLKDHERSKGQNKKAPTIPIME